MSQLIATIAAKLNAVPSNHLRSAVAPTPPITHAPAVAVLAAAVLVALPPNSQTATGPWSEQKAHMA
jgi:hypothetical protein